MEKDAQRPKKKGPKFRKKEKKKPTDGKTLAERIISQRAAQGNGDDSDYGTTERNDNQVQGGKNSENRDDLSPSKSVDISHLTGNEKRSPTPEPTLGENHSGSGTDQNGQQTQSTNDGTGTSDKPQETAKKPPSSTSDSPPPPHAKDDANESEEVKDSKQKNHQEGSRPGSASSARSQSVNNSKDSDKATAASDERSQEKHSTNSSDNLQVNEQEQQQQQGSRSPESSPTSTGKADEEVVADDDDAGNSQTDTKSKTSVQNSTNRQNNGAEDSIDASINVKDGDSSTDSDELRLTAGSSSAEVNANSENDDSSLQDSGKTETSRTNSAEKDASAHIELGSDNSETPTNQNVDASIHASTENNPEVPSGSSDGGLAESPSSTQPKSNDPKLENSSEDKIDQPSENSAAVKNGELPRSNTFVKGSGGDSPSENDPVAKFVKKDLDKMDSIEIDACMKTLEEMVDQSLQSLVSGDKEEPKVLPINEELKKKVLSEDFQKKIDSFLADL
ncbi:clumping factor A-like isoform X2 [Octopus sinensis]|uniref:Clumping factor A-like isoform X2 n=1 Tax=Octopus sinensis TaxID=2607531 RepID=A0A7E6FHG2_9MOLL|nr:clumping factor A-like isoform X2 [Octopus sinensis]